MRKVLLSLSVMLGLLMLCASASYAHPPSDIKVQMNTKTHVLTVTAYHQVMDPKSHYIYEIDVWLNGTQIVMQKFSCQTDNKVQTATYTVPDAKPGDTIKVSATCNKFGTKAVTVKAQ